MSALAARVGSAGAGAEVTLALVAAALWVGVLPLQLVALAA